MIDLQYFLDEQSALQRKMPSPHPTDLFLNAFDVPEMALLDEDGHYENTDADRKPLIDFFHWNVTATVDELHEMLGEMGWKPWATSRFINLEAARAEAIDALHFLLNIFLGLGMDAESIKLAYDNKHAKNIRRQEEGYDGVSTKCPGCGRALDDDAVECREEEPTIFFCSVVNARFNRGSDGLVRRRKS
jgi:hypothetical protein